MSTCRTAVTLSWDRLSSLEPELVARAGKVEYRESKFEVPFLGDTCIVDVENQKILRDRTEVGDYISVLILHYLIGVKDMPLSGKMLSFKGFPSGRFYFPAFRQRSLQPLLETFGDYPESLFVSGEALGAERIAQGDAGITVKVFPKLPLSIIIWKGDKELLSEATVLFDATASQILETEDLSAAAAILARRLVREGRDSFRR